MVRLYRPNEQFMTGLISLVGDVFGECGVPYQIVDRRNKTADNFPELEFVQPPFYQQREYQDFTIKRSIARTRGILNIGTGGGKTTVVAELIGRLKVKPFVFYTLTKDLLYQAIDRLSSCLNCEIGQVGDGVVNVRDVTVCTKDAVVYALNKGKRLNLAQYKFDNEDVWDEKSVFGESDTDKIISMVKQSRGLYTDEVHHAAAQTVRDLVLASENAYWRFGGTATLIREDGEELIIQGLFGRRIVDISLSYLIKAGWLVPATVFFVPVSFESMLYRSYQQIYKHCVTDNEELTQAIANMTTYLVSKGKRNLILVNHKVHGKRIKDHIPGSVFLTGEENSTKRMKAINDMR